MTSEQHRARCHTVLRAVDAGIDGWVGEGAETDRQAGRQNVSARRNPLKSPGLCLPVGITEGFGVTPLAGPMPAGKVCPRCCLNTQSWAGLGVTAQ